MYDKTSHITKLQFSLREPIPEEQRGKQLKKISHINPRPPHGHICMSVHMLMWAHIHIHVSSYAVYLHHACIHSKQRQQKKRQLERSVAVSSPTKVYHDEGKVTTEKCSILTSKGVGHQCGGRESDFKKHFHFHSFAYQSPVNCLVTDLCHR